MGNREFSDGGNHVMKKHPIQMGMGGGGGV